MAQHVPGDAADPVPRARVVECAVRRGRLAVLPGKRLGGQGARTPGAAPRHQHPDPLQRDTVMHQLRSCCWFAGLLVCWFVGLLVCWFAGLLVCWFVGLLVCWFAGLLVGWLLLHAPH